MEIREDQLEALRSTMRKENPEIVAQALRAQGVVVDEPRKGRLLSALDARNHRTEVAFQEDGLMERLTMPSGASYLFEHNAAGQLSALERSGGGPRVELSHDAEGRISEVHQLGLARYHFGYEEGRLAQVDYPDDTKLKLGHDEKGQLVAITNRGGATTRYGRDDEGRLSHIVDALGRETRFELEGESLAAIHFPDGSSEHFAQSADGQNGRLVLRNGDAVFHHQSRDNSENRISWQDGHFVAFDRDAEGRLVGIRNERTSIKLSLDEEGHVIKERSAEGTVQCAYDPEGRLAHLGTPFGDTLHYHYDEDGRLNRLVDWEGRSHEVSYGLDGNVAELKHGNGLVERHSYGRAARLGHARVTTAAGRVVSEQRYHYDACERLIGRDELSDRDGLREQIRYTQGGQLEAVINARTGRSSERYGYDAKGNMVRDGDTTIEVGLMDEPVRRGEHAIRYNRLGHLLGIEAGPRSTRCVYGANGTLRAAEVGEQIWEYEYDGLGRRILKTDGQRTFRYGYHGHQLLWEEYDAGKGAAPIRRDYLFLPDSVVPVAFREHGRTYFLQTDGRGAVIRAFHEDGRVAWRARYDAFGQAHVEVAEVRQPFRLAGQYHDEETGLHYSLGRYYSPRLKTYLARDPLWLRPTASNYSYAGNDPYNLVDPFGALAFLAAAAAVAVGAAVGAVVGGVMSAATGGSFVDGAVEGGIAGAAAVVGGLIGGVVALVGAGLAGTVLGALATTAGKQFLNGEEICWACAAKAAGVALAIDVALLGLGRIPPVKRAAIALGEKLKKMGDAAKFWKKPPTAAAAPPPFPDASLKGKPGDEIPDNLTIDDFDFDDVTVVPTKPRKVAAEDFDLDAATVPRPIVPKAKYADDAVKLQPMFAGEHKPGNAVWRREKGVVDYLDAHERQAKRLHVVDGRLYDAEGKPFDTRKAKTVFGEAKAIAVMDLDGNIYASNDALLAKFHHSSFMAGEPVAWAGEISVKKGQLLTLDNQSGHYKPPNSANMAVGKELREMGTNLDKIKVDHVVKKFPSLR